MEGQNIKEGSDDDNNANAFDLVIETHKGEVKLGKEGCKKGDSDKSVTEEKDKGMKENRSFLRAKEENQTEISGENRNKTWSSNIHKIKETDSPDNMGVTSRTEPIVNYQEGQNITVKDKKLIMQLPRQIIQ